MRMLAVVGDAWQQRTPARVRRRRGTGGLDHHGDQAPERPPGLIRRLPPSGLHTVPRQTRAVPTSLQAVTLASGRRALLSAPQVYLALYLALKSLVKRCHLLLEGLEGAPRCQRTPEQLQSSATPASLPHAASRRQGRLPGTQPSGQQLIERRRKLLVRPLRKVDDHLPPRPRRGELREGPEQRVFDPRDGRIQVIEAGREVRGQAPFIRRHQCQGLTAGSRRSAPRRVTLHRPGGVELAEGGRRLHVKRNGCELVLGEPLEQRAGQVEVQQARRPDGLRAESVPVVQLVAIPVQLLEDPGFRLPIPPRPRIKSTLASKFRESSRRTRSGTISSCTSSWWRRASALPGSSARISSHRSRMRSRNTLPSSSTSVAVHDHLGRVVQEDERQTGVADRSPVERCLASSSWTAVISRRPGHPGAESRGHRRGRLSPTAWLASPFPALPTLSCLSQVHIVPLAPVTGNSVSVTAAGKGPQPFAPASGCDQRRPLRAARESTLRS